LVVAVLVLLEVHPHKERQEVIQYLAQLLLQAAVVVVQLLELRLTVVLVVLVAAVGTMAVA
jgi:hypothetical protein